MHLEVLVNPKRIQCFGIKSRKKHTYHDKQVYLTVLHAEREVFVIVLKLLAIGTVFSAKHLVVFGYRTVQEFPTRSIQSFGVGRVFIVDNARCLILFFIGGIGKYRSDTKPFVQWQQLLLLLEFLIILDGCRNGIHAEDGVKTSQQVLLLLFLLSVVFCHVCHVFHHAIGITLIPLGLHVEIVKDILHVVGNSLWGGKGLVCFYAPHFFVVNVILCLDGLDIVHLKLQYVFIAYGINDGV